MASYTEHLNLLKKNPATDGADTFNIETMLNENWDKIDEAVAKKAELGADGKIPAEQLPEMNYDTAGSAATVQANLDAHTGNKSNPHGVTAAQVGARADTWVPSWSEVSGKPGTFPPSGHDHDAANINSGTLPVARGGTGVPTLAQLAQSLFPTQISSLPDTSYNFAITGPGWSGNGYMSFQALMSQLAANSVCRIATGTYTGTGNYQVITIVFPFSPTFFAIPTAYWSNTGGSYISIPSVGNGDPFPIIVLSSFQQNVTRDVSALGYQATATYDPNTRTLTIRTGNSYNPNGAGSVYYWIAI